MYLISWGFQKHGGLNNMPNAIKTGFFGAFYSASPLTVIWLVFNHAPPLLILGLMISTLIGFILFISVVTRYYINHQRLSPEEKTYFKQPKN